MKMKLEIDLEPFRIPSEVYIIENPVLRQDGFKTPRSFKLSELDDDTLDLLCDQFRSDIFAAARKKK